MKCSVHVFLLWVLSVSVRPPVCLSVCHNFPVGSLQLTCLGWVLHLKLDLYKKLMFSVEYFKGIVKRSFF